VCGCLYERTHWALSARATRRHAPVFPALVLLPAVPAAIQIAFHRAPFLPHRRRSYRVRTDASPVTVRSVWALSHPTDIYISHLFGPSLGFRAGSCSELKSVRARVHQETEFGMRMVLGPILKRSVGLYPPVGIFGPVWFLGLFLDPVLVLGSLFGSWNSNKLPLSLPLFSPELHPSPAHCFRAHKCGHRASPSVRK